MICVPYMLVFPFFPSVGGCVISSVRLKDQLWERYAFILLLLCPLVPGIQKILVDDDS
jgi:hypothetical protein